MNNSNRFLLLAGVVGTLLTAAPLVQAESGPGQVWQKQVWQKADTNQDGALDRSEFDAMRGAHFTRFDDDGNRIVTAAEIGAFIAARHAQNADGVGAAEASTQKKNHGERMLKRLDTDGDGSITVAEWQASAEKRFARLDANSDGKIEPAEFPKRHKKASDASQSEPAQP